MLSIDVIASIMRYRKHSFNVFSASALLILSFSPALIKHPGFLLSFSAVAGILFSTTWMKRVNTIKSSLLRWLASSTLISVSAQLATLPVGLFFFGQFPVYFLPANLLAVPLSSIVSFSGFIGFILNRVEYLGDICIWIVMTSIDILIIWSKRIASLPFASAAIPKPDISQAILLSCIVILLFLGKQLKTKNSFVFMLLALAISSFSTLFRDKSASDKKTFSEAILVVADHSASLKLHSTKSSGFQNVKLTNTYQSRMVYFRINNDLIVLTSNFDSATFSFANNGRIHFNFIKGFFKRHYQLPITSDVIKNLSYLEFWIRPRKGIYRLFW
jgi:hypothetical protein